MMSGNQMLVHHPLPSRVPISRKLQRVESGPESALGQEIRSPRHGLNFLAATPAPTEFSVCQCLGPSPDLLHLVYRIQIGISICSVGQVQCPQ